MNNCVLEVEDLCKTYIINKNSNNVLRNVNFSMAEGEFVTIMGPSGSGKSTLLYTVSGMDKMTSGKVIFDGDNISNLGEKQMARLRLEKMGFVFQQMYVMKKLCMFDNIVLPGYQGRKMSRKEVNQRAEQLMRRLGIIEVAERDMTEVSGGELQRVCLCRALINNPKMVFVDEPTGALNSKASREVLRELAEVNRNGTGILMVTHNEKVAAYSDRILYLVDGDIQGELTLGKLSEKQELAARERKVKNWLENRGW